MDTTTRWLEGSKYRWHLPNTDDPLAISKISATHNITPAIAHTLASRGMTDADAIRSFLFTTYEKDVANARLLKDAFRAVERILKAIDTNEKILIFGDYDVDGITSTALFLVSLLPLGANINFYLPNRKRDGYGLSKKIVERAASNNYTLLITVDNGITAHEAALAAAEANIDLIITDHHRPHDTLPVAHSIVNPQQEDCEFPHKILAGAGVSFKILSLIYEIKNLQLPEKVYELLMLGTVADVVPLITENRYWVRKGLTKINETRSYAMQVLAKNGKVTKDKINSLDIGFMIAPQLNALGRLDDPREAVKFLISSDHKEVERVGAILKTINEERKRIDRAIYDEVNQAIVNKTIDLEKENLIIAAKATWPAGVIGLVAGKLMHNYGKPAILLHLDKNGIAKGSCRSIPEFNIFDALNECKDLLLSFGGHSCAAGLKLKQEHIPLLKERIEEKIARELRPDQLQPKLEIDAKLSLGEMGKQLMHDLEQLEPFGNKNPEPTFMVENVQLQKEPKLLKDAHVKCTVFSEGVLKPVIFFNRPDLYATFNQLGEKPFTIAGNVTKNEWNGRTSIELRGSDVAIDN